MDSDWDRDFWFERLVRKLEGSAQPRPGARLWCSKGEERSRAAASAFQLELAPLTKAMAWVIVSDTGTYLFNIDDGRVDEKVFPCGSSRAGRMDAEVYDELLERYGWHRKYDG